MSGNTISYHKTPLPETSRHYLRNSASEPMDSTLDTASSAPSHLHPPGFDGLFNTEGLESSELENMNPQTFLPLSLEEVRDHLLKNKTAQPMKPEKMKALMEKMVGGPKFQDLIRIAVYVSATTRYLEFPDCFHSKGNLRAPWLYVLTEKVQEEREKKRQRVPEAAGDNQTPDASNSNDKQRLRRSLNTPVAVRLPSISKSPKEEFCQTCEAAPIAQNGRDQRLCASCADLVGVSVPRKSSKTSNNKKPNASDDTKTARRLPASRDQLAEEPTSKRTKSFGRDRLSSLSPDPIAQAPSPSSYQRKSTESTSRPRIILNNSHPSPPSIPASQVSFTPSSAIEETPRKKIKVQAESSRGNPDSSLQTRRPSQSITCSDPTCSRGQYGTGLLNQLWQISIKDAQAHLDQYGTWFCPDCTQLMNEQQVQSPLPAESLRNNPLYGESWLDHEDKICRPLQRLSGMLAQYIAMAAQPPSRVAFCDLPSIRYETSDNSTVNLLRQLVDVYDGVSIKEKVENLNMEPSTSSWINGVLMLLIKQFIFETGSPFEDTSSWREMLAETGDSSDMIDMMVQDVRYRTMKAAASGDLMKPEAKAFVQRQTFRDNTLVKQLNNVMLPFVGNNGEVNQFHEDITKIASLLNISMSTYRGEYAPIYPKLEEALDPIYHTLDDSELETPGVNPQALIGNPILFTTMVGVKYKAPGREWVVCSRAKVRMLRPTMPKA